GASYAGAAGYARWSQHAMLLPYIEQGSLYKSINFSMPPDTPGMGGVIGFMPAYVNASGNNGVACRTLISAFLCPSDVYPNDPWEAQNNYAANQGGWLCDRGDSPGAATIATTEVQTGVFYFLSRVRASDVRDGLSQTAFFSEKLRGTGIPNPRTDLFVIPNQTSLASTYSTCQGINPLTATPLTSKWGFSWVMGENCCTIYNHVSTPNTNSCAGFPVPASGMTDMSM